jgi:hypothetical protein
MLAAMAEDLSRALERLASGDYRPSTFLERGVSVPFTTPVLLGGRIRPGRRRGLECVIANLSGGRGFYVIDWQALSGLGQHTLHDERLLGLLGELPGVTPSVIRAAARQVAAEGFAGRAAAAAVIAAERDRPAERQRLNLLLLHRLVRQTETAEEARIPIESVVGPDQRERARRAIQRAGQILGTTPQAVFGWVEEVTDLLLDIGLPDSPVPARARRQVAAVERMAREVAAWAARTPAARELRVAEVITEVAELTLRCCRIVLGHLDSESASMLHLLRAWREDAARLRLVSERPDWLLDGWALICGLWRDATPASRLSTAWEMALLLPVLPKEAAAWCGIQADWERPRMLQKVVPVRQDWLSGRTLDVIARSERMLGTPA